MELESVRDTVDDFREEIIPSVVGQYIVPGSLDESWDLDGLQTELKRLTNEDFDVKGWLEADPNIPEEEFANRVVSQLVEGYALKEEAAGEEGLRNFEKYVMLQALDEHWK